MNYETLKVKLDYSPWYKKWLEEQGSFDLGKQREPRVKAKFSIEEVKHEPQHQKNTTS